MSECTAALVLMNLSHSPAIKLANNNQGNVLKTDSTITRQTNRRHVTRISRESGRPDYIVQTKDKFLENCPEFLEKLIDRTGRVFTTAYFRRFLCLLFKIVCTLNFTILDLREDLPAVQSCTHA